MFSQSNQKLGVFLLLAGLLSGGAAAQGMYKCKDAAGKITYAGRECHLLGLTDAGEVTGRAVVTPAIKSKEPPQTTFSSPEAVGSRDASPAAMAPPATGEKESDRRCFTIKTAKGTATRCNDKPDDEDTGAK